MGSCKSEKFCVLCYRKSFGVIQVDRNNSLESRLILGHLQKDNHLISGKKCRDYLEDGGSLCTRCQSVIFTALTSKLELEETEQDVRRRQRELLTQLKKLKDQIDNFQVWMLSVDRLVEVSKSGKMPKASGLEKDLVNFREKILKVVANLQLFQKLTTTGLEAESINLNEPSEGYDNYLSDAADDVKSEEVFDDDDESDDPFQDDQPRMAPEVKMELEQDTFENESPPGSDEDDDDEEYKLSFPTSADDPQADLLFEEPTVDFQEIGITPQVVQPEQDPLTFNGFQKCGQCGKMIKVNQFVLHMRVHTGEKPYKCQYCHLSFTQWGNLRAHRLRYHPDAQPYSCKHCPESFKDKPGLKAHMSKVHPGMIGRKTVKKETCQFCGKILGYQHMKQHLLTHTGERPNKCELCDKGFSQASGLKVHRKKVHGLDAPKNK